MEIALDLLSRVRGNTYVTVTVALLSLIVFFYFNYSTRPLRGIPYVGGPKWDILNIKAQYRFVTDCKNLIKEGLQKYNGPFQVIGYVPITVLPPRYVPLVKDHPNLDFGKSAEMRLFGQYPGLDWAHKINENRVFQESLRINMTQYLKWTPYTIGKDAAEMGVRLSTLVFLGKRFSNNKEWLYICTQYPEGVWAAISGLLSTPKFLRSIVYRFLPGIIALKKLGEVAKTLILPEIEERRRLRDAGIDVKFNDALEWYYKNSNKRGQEEDFDAVSAMISLAFASTHTTVDLLCNVLYDLAAHSECIGPLREEIDRVLAEDGGWKKTTLYKMRLMDSFLKETQRMNPVQLTSMNRYVKQTTILSDGTRLPRGSLVSVSLEGLRDASQFAEPDVFDGFRFARKRQESGQENQWQFTSTRNEFPSFGHGQWSCPGRFLVANELKIFLAELLLRYDVGYPAGVTRPPGGWFAMESQVNKDTPLVFRLREKV
ncbi:cytochrome P450 [Colletotrichum phormii]|uniref:Cytochrome P450 n=1 Tax=Colletotrichum phormii TaxID=359342 RepID=A0AAJ0EEJ0_9PEZI|nr:cytochrome P450 [Colletotrichum phormii]KAK1637087.1 cytochrome P450 [Colletotrichum phormii]